MLLRFRAYLGRFARDLRGISKFYKFHGLFCTLISGGLSCQATFGRDWWFYRSLYRLLGVPVPSYIPLGHGIKVHQFSRFPFWLLWNVFRKRVSRPARFAQFYC